MAIANRGFKSCFRDALVRKFPLNIITLVIWTGLFSMFIAMVATIWVFYSRYTDDFGNSVPCSCTIKNGSMFVPDECISQALGQSSISRGVFALFSLLAVLKKS